MQLHTHTHLAHTCTHLPPSVLTPPPVDDFWGPHNGRQATWARLSCLSAGVGVCCASVCVCVPGVCRVLVWDVSTTCTFNLHNLEQTNRFLFRQFRLPGLGLFALFIWKTTSEDSSTRFEVLSYFISDETCRTLDETYLGCSFQFDSFSNART